MLPLIQGSTSGFKGFEEPELEVNFLEIEPWYVQAQPCLRHKEQSLEVQHLQRLAD